MSLARTPAPAGPTDHEVAARHIRALLGRAAESGRFRDLAVISTRHDRIIAQVPRQNETVYIKAFTCAQASLRVMRAVRALRSAAHILRGGTSRVVACMHAAPAEGYFVTRAAPGEPVQRILRSPSSSSRWEAARLSGCWLGHYSRVGHRAAGFLAHGFGNGRMAFRQRRNPRALAQDDLLVSLDAWLDDAATRLDRQPLRHARIHGDFIARNLHLSGGTIHALDMDEQRFGHPAAEIASFLVQFQASGQPAADARFGIEAGLWEAMRASDALPPNEWDSFLPLFIAWELERRLIVTRTMPAIHARLREMTRQLLESRIT